MSEGLSEKEELYDGEGDRFTVPGSQPLSVRVSLEVEQCMVHTLELVEGLKRLGDK